MTLDEFIAEREITLAILSGPERRKDGDGWEHDAYLLALRIGPREITSPWKQDTAVESLPTCAGVLENLTRAARGYLDARRFEDWADAYGYDTDSRRAESIYRAIGIQTHKLRVLLGEDALQVLLGIEEL